MPDCLWVKEVLFFFTLFRSFSALWLSDAAHTHSFFSFNPPGRQKNRRRSRRRRKPFLFAKAESISTRRVSEGPQSFSSTPGVLATDCVFGASIDLSHTHYGQFQLDGGTVIKALKREALLILHALSDSLSAPGHLKKSPSLRALSLRALEYCILTEIGQQS